MGKMSRDKGRRGQTEAAHLLKDRDWSIIETSSGKKCEDIVAESPEGKRYSVEVKKHRVLNLGAFLTQAREQAAARKLDWMLIAHLSGTSSWLIMRKGEAPTIWTRK